MPTKRLPDDSSGEYVYRGIHKGHPDWNNALNGKVVPGNPNSIIDADIHNYGGVSNNSPFTSWSRNADVARKFAGEDGVVLRIKSGTPEPGSSWRWEWSPDIYGEQEVLLKGIRTSGIEVFLP